MQQRLVRWFWCTGIAALFWASGAAASVVGPPDYIVGQVTFPGAATGDVAVVGTAVFTGQGSFGGGTQSVARRDWDGTVTTVVANLNSIGGLAGTHAYLFITDNGGEQSGALTGDTVFALPNPTIVSSPVSAVGLEIDAPGSIPFVQGIALAPDGEPYVGDAAGSGSGRVLRHRAFGYPPFDTLFTGYDYVAGLAFDEEGRLYFGELTNSFVGRILRYDPVTNTHALIVSGLSGAYDQAFDHRGRLLVTGGFTNDFSSSTIVAVDELGNVTEFARGFSFTTGIDVDPISGRVYVVDFGSADVTTFTPLDRLVGGGGVASRDCMSEFSDVVPLLNRKGQPTSKSECRDGDACDRDGAANGTCTFAVGVCMRVPRTGCTVPGLASIEIAQPGQAALDTSVQTLLAAAQANLGGTGPVCVGPVPVQVPLVSTPRGLRPGRKALRVRVRDAAQRTDIDRLTLRCLP
ncbi:MAG: hypothetical protein N3C12_05740 [Candidatus Binatia bacterium]|nr:hypothetical protein [Candidatus Binatia bacterium]